MRAFFLSTLRLGFGTWQPEDLGLAAQLWGDARVTALIGGPFGAAQVERRLREEIARQEAHGVQYWPLFNLADGAHVGCCGLRPSADQLVAGEPGVFELGFHLRPAFWGRGLASEAAQAVIEHAFTRLRASRLVAGHHPANRDSRRLLERLGFRYTHDALYGPTGLHHRNYTLDAAEYLQGSPAPAS